jgi:hypothetical protein
MISSIEDVPRGLPFVSLRRWEVQDKLPGTSQRLHPLPTG